MTETAVSSQQKRALVLLIKSIFDQIDEVWSLKTQGHSAHLSSQMLGEMCSVLRDLDPELQEIYFNYLMVLGSGETSRPARVSEDYATTVADRKQALLEELRRLLSRAA